MCAVSADKQSVSRTPRGTCTVRGLSTRTTAGLLVIYLFTFLLSGQSAIQRATAAQVFLFYSISTSWRKKTQKSRWGSGAADPSAMKEGRRMKTDEERDRIRDEPEGNGSAGRRLVYHFLLQVDAPQVSR